MGVTRSWCYSHSVCVRRGCNLVGVRGSLRTHLHLWRVDRTTAGRIKSAFYPPAEALKSARPLPKREDLVIEDVSDEEWAAFLEALAEA